MTFLTDGVNWIPWIAGGISFVLTLLCTPVVIKVAYKFNWIAQPKKDRWHSKPTALMGGIALFTSAAITMLIMNGVGVPWTICLGAAIMFVVGLVDDLKTIRPGGKLIAQLCATGLLLYEGYMFGDGFPYWLLLPLTLFWMIGITNALNLLDNMDGLAAGIACTIALVLAGFALMNGNTAGAVMALTIAGTAGGFLVFNFKPARIFMGDSGSMFLGYSVAALALMVQAEAPAGSGLVIMLVLALTMAVPILDTSLVTIVRTLSGRSISQGGRDHTSHRLVFLGLSEKNAVLVLYGISLSMGGFALLSHFFAPSLFFAVAAFLLIGVVIFGVYLASVDVYKIREDLGYFSTRAYLFNERVFSMVHTVLGPNWKASFGIFADLILVVSSFVLAHYLRFESTLTAESLESIYLVLPFLGLLKITLFYFLGLYRSVWRHAGMPELLRVVKATTVASVVSAGMLAYLNILPVFSVSVFVIDWLVVSISVAAVRFGFKALRQYVTTRRQGGRRVILYGAGDAGALTLREIHQNMELNLKPIGFIDDDPSKHGMTIEGVPVLGSFNDFARIMFEHQPEGVLITTDRMTEARRKETCVECTRFDVECMAFQLHIGTLPAWPAFNGSFKVETKETHQD